MVVYYFSSFLSNGMCAFRFVGMVDIIPAYASLNKDNVIEREFHGNKLLP